MLIRPHSTCHPQSYLACTRAPHVATLPRCAPSRKCSHGAIFPFSTGTERPEVAHGRSRLRGQAARGEAQAMARVRAYAPCLRLDCTWIAPCLPVEACDWIASDGPSWDPWMTPLIRSLAHAFRVHLDCTLMISDCTVLRPSSGTCPSCCKQFEWPIPRESIRSASCRRRSANSRWRFWQPEPRRGWQLRHGQRHQQHH